MTNSSTLSGGLAVAAMALLQSGGPLARRSSQKEKRITYSLDVSMSEGLVSYVLFLQMLSGLAKFMEEAQTD